MRRPVCLFVLLFCGSVWAALLIWPPQPEIGEKAEGRYVTLRGTVDSKEYALRSPGDEVYIRLTLKNAEMESKIPQEGAFVMHDDDKVLCLIEEEPEVQQEWAGEGAAVRVRGRIRLFKRPTNDGEFDAFTYYTAIGGYLFTLADAHILSYTDERDPVKAALFRVRKSLCDALDRIYDGRHGKFGRQCASVMKAMLLGQSSLTDPDVKARYQAAGIIHVICVSGLHISLIGTGIYTFLRKCRVPTAVSFGISVTLLYLYGVMTGLHTSCLRALVMFGLRAGAGAVGRTYDMLTATAVAAALILIGQPSYICHSGFLFSFAAVSAAALLMPVIPGAVKPLAIPIFTLPVQLCFFYTFPLYSVLLNMIVIFMAPFLMIGGGISLLLEMIAGQITEKIFLGRALKAAAGAAGEVPVLILRLFETLCSLTEKLPFSTLTPGKPPGWVVALYCIILGAVILDANIRVSTKMRTHLIHLACISFAVFLIFHVRYEPPFALYMWDVGQGDGLCIRTKDESGECTILVDGGSSSKKSIGKNIEIPFLKYHGISRIDYCIMTHDDLDHCSGLLELLQQSDEPGGIRIGYVGIPSVLQKRKGETYLRVEEICARKGIPISYLHRGMALTDGELNLQCIHPGADAAYEDANEYSVVLLLRYGNFRAILTGDLEGQGETDMLEYLGNKEIPVDILKAAHHGSKGGTTQRFLNQIPARTALISCGKGNRYGHPSPETVQRIEEAGMEIFDTREDGQICVTTDGRGEYSVHTFY